MRPLCGAGLVLVLAACHGPSLATCNFTQGSISLAPDVGSAQLTVCAWNGDGDKPAFILRTDTFKLAIQFRGSGNNDAWSLVRWSGALPPFSDDAQDARAIDQPLNGGQAAMAVHLDIPPADGVANGGVVNMTGRPLPTAIGSAGAATVTFQQDDASLTGGGSIDGSVTLSLGTVAVQ